MGVMYGYMVDNSGISEGVYRVRRSREISKFLVLHKSEIGASCEVTRTLGSVHPRTGTSGVAITSGACGHAQLAGAWSGGAWFEGWYLGQLIGWIKEGKGIAV